MKLNKKLMISALGLCALPFAHAADFQDFGNVIRVQPRVEQVRQPRQECRTEYVQVPVQQQQRSGGGSVVGGIAGALLGSQVGSGNGKVAAAAVGAIAGSMVGNNIENQNRGYDNGPQVQEQAVRQCRNVDAYESRTVGFDVTYEYNGQRYTSFMNREPGKQIRLNVSVEPAQN